DSSSPPAFDLYGARRAPRRRWRRGPRGLGPVSRRAVPDKLYFAKGNGSSKRENLSRPSGGGLNPQDFHARCALLAIPLWSGMCRGTKLHALPTAIPLVIFRRGVTRQHDMATDRVQHFRQFPVLIHRHLVLISVMPGARGEQVRWIAIEQRLRCIVLPDDFLPRKVLDLHPTETLDHRWQN